MGALLGLAVRNLLRNRWRTALPAAALVVGVAVMVFLQAFMDGFVHSLVADAVHARMGAIQVHRKRNRGGAGGVGHGRHVVRAA